MHFDRNSLKELFQNFIKAVIYDVKALFLRCKYIEFTTQKECFYSQNGAK